MSRETINKIFTRAIIDPQFSQKLLANPLKTIEEAGFDLTPGEQESFQNIKARDIAELSQIVLDRLEFQG